MILVLVRKCLFGNVRSMKELSSIVVAFLEVKYVLSGLQQGTQEKETRIVE